MTWAWQLTHSADEPIHGVTPYENEDALIADVKKSVAEGKAQAGHPPRVLVIGALGRCGRGAVDLCTKAGLQDIIVRSDTSQSQSFANMSAEMGSSRDIGEIGPIPGNYRIRHLRQLHLPLSQNPTLHRPTIALII